MATLPAGTYQVSLFKNQWADGVLNTSVTPHTYVTPNNGGGPISSWHPSTDKVGWKIALKPPGSTAAVTITFSNGHYYGQQRPPIQMGQASGFPPGPQQDPQDTWTATVKGSGMEAGAPETV